MIAIKYRLEGFKEMQAKLERAGVQTLPTVEDAVRLGMIRARNTAMKDYLTGPRPAKLGVRSGRLRSSIFWFVNRRANQIVGTIGTNVVYAPIHEFGGIIVPKRAKWLRFMVRPGQWVSVKKVTMPKRPFLHPALEDNRQAIMDLIMTGEVKLLQSELGLKERFKIQKTKGLW